MLREYTEKKLRLARYKLLKDGTYYAEIPGVRGVWASAKNLEQCRRDLRDVLEEWRCLWISEQRMHAM